jgi:Fe-S-cluster containining protein
VSRQQRHARLKQSIEAVSRHGINLKAGQSDRLWSSIAATRILLDILSGHSPSRASQAAKRAHEFFETSLQNNPSEPQIECVKGCTFCCHLRVSAMAPEIFLIASHLRREYKNDPEIALNRLRAADRNSRGLSGGQRAKSKLPCGLLDDRLCTVYAARPSTCRGHTSISVRTCERGFHGEDVEVLTPSVWAYLRSAHNQAMWAALTAVHLPADSYELNHALCVALESPDAEARWLKGENVFAEVACERLADVLDREARTRIIDRLIAGALGKEIPQPA